MPTVKACLWNIQNYGSGTIQTKWGPDSDLRNRFIRNFLRDQQIDVLMIMEPGAFSLASLRDMTRWLNGGLPAADADWCTSLTGSAMASGAPNPPTSAFDVTYMTDARVEGYAVAWRDGRANFSVLEGLHPIGTVPVHSTRNNNPPAQAPLNMTTLGRPTGNYDIYPPAGGRKRGRTERVFGAQGGYVSSGVFPYDETGAEMDHWADLPFPTTSTRNPSQLRMHQARRPAYVVLELNNGGNASRRLCPVAAYHAPSNAKKAEFGAMMAGLGRELYATNDLDINGDPDADELVHCRTTVMGGDFNYSVDAAQWPEWYAFFTGRFLRARAGGAAADPAPPPTDTDPERRTTVQILEGDHTTPITSANLDNYLYHKIDLVFTRGDAAGERVNIPALLLNDAGTYDATLQAFHTHLAGVVAGLTGPNQRQTTTGPQEYRWVQDAQKRWSQEWKPMICGAWGGTFRSWTTFMRQLRNGRITDARRAAEFYHIFVSDHLPLVVTITW